MRVVIQRVKKASLYIENSYKGSIDKGVVVLVGFKKGDSESDVKYIRDKIFNLRIFEDENGKMNYSVGKINGDIMLVPQFTLYGDVKNSNRPDFSNAENFSKANTLFDIFKNEIRRTGLNLLCGEFGKEMLVEIHNDGPVTIIIDK